MTDTKEKAPETHRLKFTIKGRGEKDSEVVDAIFATALEANLNRAKALLKEIAIKLECDHDDHILELLTDRIEEADLMGEIKRFNLCVSYAQKSMTWTVQTNDYSELFSSPSLGEAVTNCVKKLNNKIALLCVETNLKRMGDGSDSWVL